MEPPKINPLRLAVSQLSFVQTFVCPDLGNGGFSFKTLKSCTHLQIEESDTPKTPSTPRTPKTPKTPGTPNLGENAVMKVNEIYGAQNCIYTFQEVKLYNAILNY